MYLYVLLSLRLESVLMMSCWVHTHMELLRMTWYENSSGNQHRPLPTPWVLSMVKFNRTLHVTNKKTKLNLQTQHNRINAKFKKRQGASLVAQWLRIRLPMQGTRVWALVREDPTCRRATKPIRHNYWACALEPRVTTTEAHAPWACTPQQEKPLQWEACAPQRRVGPARRN